MLVIEHVLSKCICSMNGLGMIRSASISVRHHHKLNQLNIVFYQLSPIIIILWRKVNTTLSFHQVKNDSKKPCSIFQNLLELSSLYRNLVLNILFFCLDFQRGCSHLPSSACYDQADSLTDIAFSSSCACNRRVHIVMLKDTLVLIRYSFFII